LPQQWQPSISDLASPDLDDQEQAAIPDLDDQERVANLDLDDQELVAKDDQLLEAKCYQVALDNPAAKQLAAKSLLEAAKCLEVAAKYYQS
jgi:hypothetical protein